MTPRGWSVYQPPSSGHNAFDECAARYGQEAGAQIAYKLQNGLFHTGKWRHKINRRILRVAWVEVDFTRYGVVFQAAPLLRVQAKDVILVIFKGEDDLAEVVPAWVVREACLRAHP